MSKWGFAAAVVAGISLGLAAASPARAALITVKPIQDQSANDSNLDGTWDTLSLADQPVLLVYNGNTTYNFRVAMEFPNNAIPHGAHVDAATLFLKFEFASGHPASAIRVSGYAGNGQITLADSNIAPNPVAPLQDSFGPPGNQYLIDVAPFIQSLVDRRAPYAGFVLENTQIIQTAILSNEDPNPANRPSLSVVYTIPLPPGLVPGALLGAAIIARKLRRARTIA
jgi:hypothetical protein